MSKSNTKNHSIFLTGRILFLIIRRLCVPWRCLMKSNQQPSMRWYPQSMIQPPIWLMPSGMVSSPMSHRPSSSHNPDLRGGFLQLWNSLPHSISMQPLAYVTCIMTKCYHRLSRIIFVCFDVSYWLATNSPHIFGYCLWRPRTSGNTISACRRLPSCHSCSHNCHHHYPSHYSYCVPSLHMNLMLLAWTAFLLPWWFPCRLVMQTIVALCRQCVLDWQDWTLLIKMICSYCSDPFEFPNLRSFCLSFVTRKIAQKPFFFVYPELRGSRYINYECNSTGILQTKRSKITE